MKLFTFLLASVVAIHSCSGTLFLARNLLERNVQHADALVKKVLTSGQTHETYDIHINRQPVCVDCGKETAQPVVPARPSFPVKGRYFYYPTSYYYPSTAYYYYPNSYSVPAVSAHKPAQRRVGVYGSGSPFGHAYFVYPSAVNAHSPVNTYKDLKSAQVHDYYHQGFQPFQFSPVPVSVYPPFSKLVRQKAGRPVVLPSHRFPDHTGFKGGVPSTDPVKGGSSTTEAPIDTEPIEQQQQEQEQIPDETPVKGFY